MHVSRESSGYLKFPKKSIVNILLADEEKGGGGGGGVGVEGGGGKTFQNQQCTSDNRLIP